MIPAPKAPEEIAEMYRALRAARNAPCNCQGECVPRCVAGGRLMDASLDALLWAMGALPARHGVIGSYMDEILKEYRAGGGK